MATQTAADLEAQILANDGSVVSITKSKIPNATYDHHYATAVRGSQNMQNGKSCWCRVTNANSLSDQADEIITALKAAGPIDPNLA